MSFRVSQKIDDPRDRRRISYIFDVLSFWGFHQSFAIGNVRVCVRVGYSLYFSAHDERPCRHNDPVRDARTLR